MPRRRCTDTAAPSEGPAPQPGPPHTSCQSQGTAKNGHAWSAPGLAFLSLCASQTLTSRALSVWEGVLYHARAHGPFRFCLVGVTYPHQVHSGSASGAQHTVIWADTLGPERLAPAWYRLGAHRHRGPRGHGLAPGPSGLSVLSASLPPRLSSACGPVLAACCHRGLYTCSFPALVGEEPAGVKIARAPPQSLPSPAPQRPRPHAPACAQPCSRTFRVAVLWWRPDAPAVSESAACSKTRGLGSVRDALFLPHASDP